MSSEEKKPAEEKVSRRSYVKYAGAAVVVVAVAAGGGYYYTQMAAPKEPIKFVHWHYRDDQITKYVSAFNAAYGENLTEETLDNATYNPLIESKHMAGEVVDMHYANNFEAFRLDYLGYLQDVDTNMSNISQIKSEMYPSVVDAFSNAAGKLQGLVYFYSSRICVTTNDSVIEKAGLAGEIPKTWPEFWDMGERIKKSGVVKYPILTHWFPFFYGVGWSIEGEMCNWHNDPDGTRVLFGRDWKPILGKELEDMLTLWAKEYKDGVVDPAILSMGGDDPMVTAFCTGQYAMNPTAIYYYKVYVDKTASKIEQDKDGYIRSTLAPIPGLIDTGMYCWPKKNHGKERSERLHKFFGYKDNTGKRLTSTAWAIGDWLNSAYPDTLKDPTVVEAYRNYLGPRTDGVLKNIDSIIAGMARPWIWRSPMCTEWEELCATVLPTVINGSITPADGVKKLKDQMDEAWKKYHAK